MDEWVRSLVLAERGQGEPIGDWDFGFHYPFEYVRDTWMMFRQHGVLPRAGGYEDQDELLMRDWATLSARYAYWSQKRDE